MAIGDESKKRFVSFDWVIKNIMKNKSYPLILNGFLTDMLGFPVVIKHILESETNQEGGSRKPDEGATKKNKQNPNDAVLSLSKMARVDLVAEEANGSLILVEIQVQPQSDFPSRMLFGVSRAVVDYLASGRPYAEIRKVYAIAILYFDLGEGRGYLYRGKTHFIEDPGKHELLLSAYQKQSVYQHYPLSERIGDVFPEYIIIKAGQFLNQINRPLDEWVYFLKNEDIKGVYPSEALSMAKKELDLLRLSTADKEAYIRYKKSFATIGSGMEEYYFKGREKGLAEGIEKGIEKGRTEGLEKGLAEGLEKGRAEGIAESKKEIKKLRIDLARTLLSRGFTKKDIMSMAAITEREYQSIMKSLESR